MFFNIINYFLPNRTIIITTKTTTRQLKLSRWIQVFIIFAITTLVTYFAIKYNRYKNYHNYAEILEENDALKAEHEKMREEFNEYDKKAQKINEYLSIANGEKLSISVKKPEVIDYKTASVVDMVKHLKDNKLYAYALLDARKKNVEKYIKKLGISHISYNKLVKTANIQRSDDSEPITVETNGEHSVGGVDEAVDSIKIVKSKPFLQISQNRITDKNFVNEIDKEIMVEKTLQSLPFGSPTQGSYRITSSYGFRTDPVRADGRLRVHRGIDMVIADEKVVSTKDGVVVFAGTKSGYGQCIDIEHRVSGSLGSVVTHYAHLDKILVVKGQKVKKGELIGIQGNTGRSTGAHVHYEIRINKQPVNPIKFLKNSVDF